MMMSDAEVAINGIGTATWIALVIQTATAVIETVEIPAGEGLALDPATVTNAAHGIPTAVDQETHILVLQSVSLQSPNLTTLPHRLLLQLCHLLSKMRR